MFTSRTAGLGEACGTRGAPRSPSWPLAQLLPSGWPLTQTLVFLLEIRLPLDPPLPRFCSRARSRTRALSGAAQAAERIKWFLTDWKRRKASLGSKAGCLYPRGKQGTESSCRHLHCSESTQRVSISWGCCNSCLFSDCIMRDFTLPEEPPSTPVSADCPAVPVLFGA